ncbi:cupin domain-containing protein [Virgibacillus sp. LDC-1]|uniref:cupin domain-containing protein n=1 Tax=Virgibacillus sp. LDC-1 TaxID=3039856 RepID=UPI0024DE931B|nr:cupin domain-containing protein [Virgibacillus sp. LDC-1]
MQRFSVSKEKKITQYDSDFYLSKIVNKASQLHIAWMRIEAGGSVGYHEEVAPQLLLIVEGKGTVLGKENIKYEVTQGDAVLWEKGEGHETVSEHGLTAIVIEGEHIDLTTISMLNKD